MQATHAAAKGGEQGYAMVALLVLMSVMAIAMTVALPAWNTLSRREKEAELVFRGEQYARAIALFQRRYAGAFPPSLDVLVNERFLRKKYKDPITNDDFQTIAVGEAVAGPQTTNPFDRSGGAGTRGQPAGQAGAAGRAGQTQATGRGGQSGATLSIQGSARGGAGGTFTVQGSVTVGPSAGIMGVTSKSTAASLRLYKGADHYNQWLFIATQASTQAGGRGAQTPGEGVRGGAPPGGRQGGPRGQGGRGAPPPPPLSPFGTGRGQAPGGAIGGR